MVSPDGFISQYWVVGRESEARARLAVAEEGYS